MNSKKKRRSMTMILGRMILRRAGKMDGRMMKRMKKMRMGTFLFDSCRSWQAFDEAGARHVSSLTTAYDVESCMELKMGVHE